MLNVSSLSILWYLPGKDFCCHFGLLRVFFVVALVFPLFGSCAEHTSLKLVPGLLME